MAYLRRNKRWLERVITQNEDYIQDDLAKLLIAPSIFSRTPWWWGLSKPTTYSTAIGEQRSFTLADGSTIELSPRSRVRVRLSDRERDIQLLDGQAFFTVTKDVNRPFVVAVDQARVRAVGTQFDVNKRRSGTTVTVLEGRVAVYQVVSQDAAESPESPDQNFSSPVWRTGSGKSRYNANVALVTSELSPK